MRIAYVCTDPGIPVFGRKGASVHAQAVLRELARAGHELHLLTPRPGPDERPAGLDGVTVHVLPAVGRGSAAEREVRAQASDAAVAAVLDALAPDLVYERYALWGRTASAWAARASVPAVLEVNAPLVDEQATFRELADTAGAEAVARDALSAAGTVVCVSDAVADWVRGVSRHPERVVVEPNGVDPERVHPGARPVAEATAATFTVGFVGTLKAWHGLDLLVDAVARLAATDPSWRLLLVGDGPMAGPLAEQASQLGLGDRLELTGAVDPADVAAHLHRMDIACAPYPAGGHAYFSPLKAYEYLAAGLPVVASAVGQLPAALDHGRLGRLVPAGDVDALARELGAVRADVAWRAEVGPAARRAALERHTWTAAVERVLAAATGRRAA